VTVMNERGAPTPVAWTKLRAPQSRMGAADAGLMQAVVAASPRHATYATAVDRESAYEILTVKLEEGARKAAEEAAAKEEAKAEKAERAEEAAAAREAKKSAPKKTSPRAPKEDEGIVEQVMGSAVVKDFMRTAAREIARGMFKSGRR
jgi:uncharacterized protein